MSLSSFAALREWLPKGNTLSDEAFTSRHRILRALLLAHVPVLFVWGLIYGVAPWHAAAEVAVPAACWLAAGKALARRLQAFFVTAGLVWCSLVIVHLSHGSIEAHFHFFVVIPFITLYQDWPPFLWAIAFTVLSHGFGSVLRPDLIFNHDDAVRRPWTWAAIHGAAVAFASLGAVTFWRAAEREQARATALAADLAGQREQASAREANHRTFSDLLVTLARRNQHLVERQLHFIEGLEREEVDERMLANLFNLDHFATRMRRNDESLIVLSGADAARRHVEPQRFSEIIRGAAGEVEDYRRVDIIVHDDPLIAGRVVASIAHLLAELIENATVFSPASTRVLVIGRSVPAGECQVDVVDSGLGMSDEDLQMYNERLASPPDADVDVVRMLGLHVVGRLAQRTGVFVRLDRNTLRGLTATVTIPAALAVLPSRAHALAAAPAPVYDPFARDARRTSRVPLVTSTAPDSALPTKAQSVSAGSSLNGAAARRAAHTALRSELAAGLGPDEGLGVGGNADRIRGAERTPNSAPSEQASDVNRSERSYSALLGGAHNGSPRDDRMVGPLTDATEPRTAAVGEDLSPFAGLRPLLSAGEEPSPVGGGLSSDQPRLLTRRIPMASLAPQLIDESDQRSPSQRGLSCFQSGVRRARALSKAAPRDPSS